VFGAAVVAAAFLRVRPRTVIRWCAVRGPGQLCTDISCGFFHLQP